MKMGERGAGCAMMCAGMSIDDEIATMCLRAKEASRRLAYASSEKRQAVLLVLAKELRARTPEVLAANALDVAAAKERGLSAAMIDRLTLTAVGIEAIAKGVEEIALLPDPVGEVVSDVRRPNGLRVRRVRVPLGVIAMVYESRPNVTIDAAALCLRVGDAAVLRGGTEARNSNLAFAKLIASALNKESLPVDAIQLVTTPDRDAIRALVQQVGTVDLAIPRGGEALVRFVTEHARVPVVQHYKGVCHTYIDGGVSAVAARDIVINAKLSRPAVCNALECLLVDAKVAEEVLPVIAEALARGGCEIRGCERTCELVPSARRALDSDYGTEFLDRVLAVRVVDGIDAAIDHVARFGSGHTEAILTADEAHAERWRREVDAACVMVNASTRFHDGGELGLGAEIGIATSRLHWRGPMGAESLTTFKWVVDGTGQIRI